ncbi:MAG TPA: lysylphosphatidylglycerol synthase domain-containing protein [Pararhizobium sp.]|uniref:lysylphosphatidylglycerol synthase domain-containing protein n=1 Tax=Pararhizobium sp. TaxID=1977563 RepID=UPI002B5B6DBE|nr:lysylphosphatidylglycerol synthase domain-containing protein [Pararhizobium sp.]HTO34502.1 lysylphosphatidylglycerol synthase domain-containing protein [Pararhizobium sp.]
MKTVRKFAWPVIGLAAILFSLYGLYHELRGLSTDDFLSSVEAVSLKAWLLAGCATLGAYAALAAYDHLALEHLGHRISLWFITVSSFTAYALSHTVGASVFSGAVVRYRAYGSKGLTAAETGVLVAFCSFTFVLGTLMLSAIVLLVEPDITARFAKFLPVSASISTGLVLLGLIALYIVGSLVGFRPLKTRWFKLEYPKPSLALRQLLIAPVELIAAAAIIYFALPEAGNPGYLVILGVFLASFSAALLSHAPGGLGVLELMFIAGLPEMDPAGVLAGLVIFRLFYLVIPFAMALIVVVIFEREQFLDARKAKRADVKDLR